MADPGPADSHCCKVGRVLEAYDLAYLDDDLVERHESGASMRDLAREVNTAIVQAAIDAEDARIVADPQGIYEVLAGEDVTPERRVRIEDALQSVGVDVDALAADLVSHVTVWTHVRDHLEIDTGRESQVDPTAARQTIAAARDREETLIANTLDRLGQHPDVAGSDVDVTVSVRVFCRDCGSSYRLDEYLDAGGCDCEAARQSETGG